MSKLFDPDRLAQFFAEEVRAADYADLLLGRAEAAGRGAPVSTASGDSYSVTFRPEEVVISHHHLEDWPPLSIAHKDFIAALRRWRGAMA